MGDLTCILETLGWNSPKATDELLPLVYQELRRMAAIQMAREVPGHTLQATALVHEAWLRLAEPHRQYWQNRAHFFSAAAEAMRRILIDHARRKNQLKRGNNPSREDLDQDDFVVNSPPDELLAVHEALEQLTLVDPTAAELVKFRYFIGMTMEESAAVMGLPKRTAEDLWTYARVWMHRYIRQSS